MEKWPENPYDLFDFWFFEAQQSSLHNPHAMTLCTSDEGGHPDARVVLFKGFVHGKFSFFSNYNSAKGLQLSSNPYAALVFHWDLNDRQVRVRGTVSKTSDSQSDEYFASRHRDSQLGAWSSPQSQQISGHDQILGNYREMERKFKNQPIPRPPHWGGYLIDPEMIEFWIAGKARLNERMRYIRINSSWDSCPVAP